MDKKGLVAGAAAYVIWGFLPVYWKLLQRVETISILANRIIWASVFICGVLLARHRFSELLATFRDKVKMKQLLPSSLFITANWGLYIIGVKSGHVLDISLGYYLNPLISFGLGVLVLREPYNKLELLAVAIAFAGILCSTVLYGSFPWLAVLLALSFGLYGLCKKKTMGVDSMVGIAVESVIVLPLALLYLFLAPGGRMTLSACDLPTLLLLLGAGPATAVPLILFAKSVSSQSLTTMAFLQYLCPTIATLVGVLLLGEPFTPEKRIAFCAILIALCIYSVSIIRKKRQQR